MVIVPCGVTANLSEADKNSLMASCDELFATLKSAGFSVENDKRDNYSPGWKFNHWELKVCFGCSVGVYAAVSVSMLQC